ncbi:MAG TPA: hypothetical protein VK453_01640 [Micromonosporaceae bacterium]|nr:hypothetical protein [Micromonosporaceae bacterium]
MTPATLRATRRMTVKDAHVLADCGIQARYKAPRCMSRRRAIDFVRPAGRNP